MRVKIKNIITVILLAAICCCCVICIIYLGKDKSGTNLVDSFNEIKEKETYVNYSKVYVGYMDLEQYDFITGKITNGTGQFLETVELEGTIEDMLLKQGDNFTAGEVMFRSVNQNYVTEYAGKIDRIIETKHGISVVLANYQDCFIMAEAPFEYAKYLKEGDEVRCYYGEELVQGEIMYVSTTVEGGNIKVGISYEDAEMNLLLNAPVEVVVVKKKAEHVIAVPVRAVINSGSVTYVRVRNEEGEDEMREVTVGLESSNEYYEIKSGLLEGELVLMDTLAN